MKILITGGCGFVGSNLALALKNDNHEVIVIDNLKRRGSELNINRLKEQDIYFHHGDIRAKEDFLSLPSVDVVIECSAEPSVLAGINESPEYLINTNLLGTVNCLEFARRNNSKFIFLSTSRVYPVKTLNEIRYIEDVNRFIISENQKLVGLSGRGVSESFSLNGARTLYGTTKLASELIIQEYQDVYGIDYIVNRCGVIAGPWQFGKVDQGVVVLWMAKHYWKGNLQYIGFNGSGKQVRDVLHILDLIDLIKIQLKAFNTFKNDTFNVGGGINSSTSLKELTGICQNITGNTIEINSSNNSRPGDLPIYITDNNKISEASGWIPKRNINILMEDIYHWICQNEDVLIKTLA